MELYYAVYLNDRWLCNIPPCNAMPQVGHYIRIGRPLYRIKFIEWPIYTGQNYITHVILHVDEVEDFV